MSGSGMARREDGAATGTEAGLPPRVVAARQSSHNPTPPPGLAGARFLAPYASSSANSRGRLYQEPGCPTRNAYQRDRDRIIHSSAFRRLTHKTQVFIYHEGDHYRSRLTHSLEVAQIARAIARLLYLDEDLAEALALAHDLGHPPFGHAGERALQEAMADHGGFDHNAQSLRVVTALECKYAGFDGLNLSWETLEGLVKHNGPLLGGPLLNRDMDTAPVADLPRAIRDYDRGHDLMLAHFASGEAQVAAAADDIAYNNHDIDDGLHAGLIDVEMLRDVPLTAHFLDEIAVTHADLAGERVIYELNRRLITLMVNDVADEGRRRLAELGANSPDDIRNAATATIGFSPALTEQLDELRSFLFQSVYRHPKVMRVMRDAEQIVRDLFQHYSRQPQLLPPEWRQRAAEVAGSERAWVIADFVAGMTDRYAITEHQRLFDASPDLR